MRPTVIAFGSALIVVLISLHVPQGLFIDPAFQLLAVQQWSRGIAPTPNHLVQADPRDISRDTSSWISHWPPGFNFLILPLIEAGLSIGASVRFLASIGLIGGSVGWVLWFSRFDLPPTLLPVLALLFPWMHYASNPLMQYSTENLAFASVPWALHFGLKLYENWNRHSLAAAFGLYLGIIYWLKYSAIFVSLGVLLFLFLRSLRKRELRPWVLTVGGCLLPIIILACLGHHFGGAANSLGEDARSGNLTWQHFVFGIGNISLAMVDLDGLLRYLLFHPGRALVHNDIVLPLVGIPGSLVALWLTFRHRGHAHALLAQCVLLSSMGALFAVWIISATAADFSARHLAMSALTIMPLCLQEGSLFYRTQERTRRTTIVLAAVVYLALPMIYGPLALMGKSCRTPKTYVAGPTGIYNPLLTDFDVNVVIKELEETGPGVWYVPDPVTALQLPGRKIIRVPDFTAVFELQAERFVSTRPVRISLLLPYHFEENGKGKIIRRSFSAVDHWEQQFVPMCALSKWNGNVAAP